MPIYEYRCAGCEKTFEFMQKVAEGPLRKCRECSGKLEKLVSRTSFLLKGGGWYSEGYSKDSAAKTDSSSDASKKKTKPAKDATKKKKAGSA